MIALQYAKALIKIYFIPHNDEEGNQLLEEHEPVLRI